MIDNTKQEGWADDPLTPSSAKRHYYKNGKSLCGKAETNKRMFLFDKETIGSKWCCDCGICIKKQKEMLHEEPLNYKKYDY